MKVSFARNAVFNGVGLAVNLLGGVILTPFVAHRLGLSAYGLVPLSLTLVNYMSLITAAVNSSTGRFMMQKVVAKDKEGFDSVVSTSLFLSLATSLVVLIVGTILTLILERLIVLPGGSEHETKILFSLMFLSFALQQGMTVFGCASFCANRLDLGATTGLIGNIVRILLTWILFQFFPARMIWIGVATLAGSLVQGVGQYLVFKYLYPETRFRFSGVSKKHISEVSAMGGWVIINQIGTLLLLNIELVFANRWLPLATAGLYGALLTWSNMLRTVVGLFASLFSPPVTALWFAGDRNALANYLERAVGFVSCLTVYPVVLIVGCAPLLIRFWLGPQYVENAPLLSLMVAHLAINLSILPHFGFQTAANKLRVPAFVTIGTSVLSIGLIFIFVKKLDLGMYGIALGGAIALMIKNALFVPLYSSAILNRPWHAFMHNLMYFLLLCAGGIGLIRMILMLSSGVAGGVVGVLAWSAVYGVLITRYYLNDDELRKVCSFLGKFGLEAFALRTIEYVRSRQ